jgi:hypothetical protein
MVLAAMLVIQSCKDPNETGLGVLPDEDIISGKFVDTFQVKLTSQLVDSTNTYRSSGSMLGTYIDPEFGQIAASIFTQFRIVGTNLAFSPDPANLTLDSIVLSLDLSNVYGRYDDAMQVQVHQITGAFPDDDEDTLYSNQAIAYDPTLDYANGFKIDFKGLTGFKDFINIRLDDSLGRKLLFADTDSLLDNGTFVNFFRGLRISTLPADASLSREPGGIFSVDLESSNSHLIMYYKDTTATKTYTFPIGSAAKYYTQIERSDYQTRLVTQILGDSSTPEVAPYAVMQAGGLIRTFVEIPGILNFPKAGINRAELVFPVAEEFLGSGDRFTPPIQILIYAADSTGKNPINSAVFNSSGTWDPASSSYVLTFTNTVMQILDKRLTSGKFILMPNQDNYSINRVILRAAGNATLKPRLKIILTEIPG